MNAKLNKRERRAAALLAHYATCERLALALGMPAEKVDGKKISVALLKIEREAHGGAEAQCNGEIYHCDGNEWHFGTSEVHAEMFDDSICERVAAVFGGVLPPGFFVNSDPRGYALKIDDGDAAGRELIESTRMHRDWGGNGILSPEITGD